MTPGQKLKLGIFSVMSALVTLLVLTTFGGLSLFSRDVSYFVDVPGGVSGLDKGSAVQLRGVRVGTVTQFELYPEHFEGVRVRLAVSPDTQIRQGARASLALQGLSGL
jgi:ABC-type transporter Mla subunit MlaD